MQGYWYEIQHSDGELVQCITVLTQDEIRNLKAAGFVIESKRADTVLLDWLRPIAWGQ